MGIDEYDSYGDYLKSIAWKSKRLKKLLTCEHNDEFGCIKCQGCDLWIPWELLQVHHLTYENIGDEDLDDLAALCDGCHNQAHGLDPPLWWQEAMESESLMVTTATIRMHTRGPRNIDEVILTCMARMELSAIRAEVKRWKRNRMTSLPQKD